MSKNNITTGLNFQSKQLYDLALNAGHWIGYKKQWYTPHEFATSLGRWEINIAEVDISDPRDVLRKGRQAFEKMVKEDKPKAEILNALKRLNAFTDKFWLKCQPDMWDIERQSL